METNTALVAVAEPMVEKANLVRKWCLISTTEAASGHPTSCLSAADITSVLFDRYFTYDLDHPHNLLNDHFVLSKGHAAPLLYTLFGLAGAYPLEDLKSLRKFASNFEGHPTPKFPYAEAATGSLGQGMSVGAGLALLTKREARQNKTFVLLGDGELAEGQVWEAANFAGYYGLDNLIAIADINRLAQSGESMFGHETEQYAVRFKAFGFDVLTIDGHDLGQIDHALQQAVQNNNGNPTVIIARTIKGKGVSLVEDRNGWHGKALKKEELEQALLELGDLDDGLRFDLRKPEGIQLPEELSKQTDTSLDFDGDKSYATREVFGEALARLGDQDSEIWALDGDVKNSTFTLTFMKAHPDRFVECFIAEQNMVSVAVGLSRSGKNPFVATFGAFLSRAADQIRMARVSEANIKFIGSHVGVSIGEDGPSQMGLEDIAFFGAMPGILILQPADAVSAVKLTTLMAGHKGMAYMRTMRPKTPVLYKNEDELTIGGSKLLRQSDHDKLTIAATGITVFEALKAADSLQEEGVAVRVVDCYSIRPIDSDTLLRCLQETEQPILITVEDHFLHGGMGDFALAALAASDVPHRVIKLGVSDISRSGKMDELLDSAGISTEKIVTQIKKSLNV
jgi:transketolase